MTNPKHNTGDTGLDNLLANVYRKVSGKPYATADGGVSDAYYENCERELREGVEALLREAELRGRHQGRVAEISAALKNKRCGCLTCDYIADRYEALRKQSKKQER